MTHHDMCSHTGAAMSLSKGCPFSLSRKQHLNTKSLTEAKVVAVGSGAPPVLWTSNFLEAQGSTIADNVMRQDSQSAMLLLECNGCASSGRQTWHINIRHFFAQLTGLHTAEHCPTMEMVRDFFTEPLQGAQIRKFCDFILGIPNDGILSDAVTPQECVGSSR